MTSSLSVEVTVPGLGALLQGVQRILMAIPVNRQLGVSYTAGPRHEPQTVSSIAGRLVRTEACA